MTGRKVGVCGGAFDPPHRVHLATARCAMHWLELDEVVFTVAGDPWQKTGSVDVTDADGSVAELAVGNELGFSLNPPTAEAGGFPPRTPVR